MEFNLEKCLKEDDGIALYMAPFGKVKVKLMDFGRFDRHVLGCFLDNDGSGYRDACWFNERCLSHIVKAKEGTDG